MSSASDIWSPTLNKSDASSLICPETAPSRSPAAESARSRSTFAISSPSGTQSQTANNLTLTPLYFHESTEFCHIKEEEYSSILGSVTQLPAATSATKSYTTSNLAASPLATVEIGFTRLSSPLPAYRAVSPPLSAYQATSRNYLTLNELYMGYASLDRVQSASYIPSKSSHFRSSKSANYLTIQDLYEMLAGKLRPSSAKWTSRSRNEPTADFATTADQRARLPVA